MHREIYLFSTYMNLSSVSIELIISIVALITATITLSFTLYKQYKNKLILDAKSLIKKCRDTVSWDTRSEDKLISWMDGVPEEDLHRASVIKLRKIQKNLVKYWGIHIEEAIKEA